MLKPPRPPHPALKPIICLEYELGHKLTDQMGFKEMMAPLRKTFYPWWGRTGDGGYTERTGVISFQTLIILGQLSSNFKII